jgi:predicted CXXCH cytochrome family protein
MRAGVAAVLLLLAASIGAAAGSRNGHLAGVECGTCHLAGNDFDQAQASKLLAPEETLCTRCHEHAVQFSHPTGFAPGRTLPAGYPLDWRGDLSCSTCHLAHGQEPGLLRGTEHAKAFCRACHEEAFFSRMKDAGISLVLSGHLHIHNGRGTHDIDAYSLQCLACHVDGHDRGGAVSVGRNGILNIVRGAAPHPIGRDYRDASRKVSFRPEREVLNKKIALPEGKVSCVSCHDAYTKDHGRLAASLNRSALCLSCHAR